MLLFPECVHLLLAHGAPVKVKNLAGWSPLAEAISYGDRQTSKHVLMICLERFILIGFVNFVWFI